jgi:hypothetical protein
VTSKAGSVNNQFSDLGAGIAILGLEPAAADVATTEPAAAGKDAKATKGKPEKAANGKDAKKPKPKAGN